MRRAWPVPWIALLLVARPCAGADFYLKDGDRVVFYGDSITQERRYTDPVEWYVLTRFPKMDVSFVHSGVGGDSVSGGRAGTINRRLDRDVLVYKPTVLTIMLGMNDAGYKPFDQAAFDAYGAGYRHILERVRKALPGVRITLIQPSPYDDVTRPVEFPEGYESVLRRYGRFVADLGKAEGCQVVDLESPLLKALETVNRANPPLARQLLPDRIHPGDAGGLVLAAALLRAWNAPETVFSVEIDAAAGRVARAEGTALSDVAKTPAGVAWTALDAALPLPLSLTDASVDLAETAGAGLAGLSRQEVRVTGLAAGRYSMKIDDEVVGRVYSGAELAAGIDLAGVDTPSSRQAEGVVGATSDHNETHWLHLKLLANASSDPETPVAARVLERLEAGALKQQHDSAQPRPRRYEVVPAP